MLGPSPSGRGLIPDVQIETADLDTMHPDRSLTVVVFDVARGVLLAQSGGRPWTGTQETQTDGLEVKSRPSHHMTWDGVPGPLLTNWVASGEIFHLYVLRFLHL